LLVREISWVSSKARVAAARPSWRLRAMASAELGIDWTLTPRARRLRASGAMWRMG
jgi:hypothetical protein